MITTLSIHEFLRQTRDLPVIDVRTPAEFAQGHIPGAFNIPLFSNEERVVVGTTYKQKSREKAILIGFELVGPKWADFIRQALHIAPGKRIAVHCWRGGMRSGAMAWALNLYGFDVILLEGGYKKFRNWVLNKFNDRLSIAVLGGFTGSGKTLVLKELGRKGEQMIDLEQLACHQGSSYGTMGYLVQPTQEQFENNLAHEISLLDANRRVWIEDESLTIGKRMIPKALWQQMRHAPLFKLDVPLNQRIEVLASEYGILDKDFLIECTERIGRRLGPEQTRDSINAIREGRISDFIRQVLVYYDKTYTTGQSRRESTVYTIECTSADSAKNTLAVLQTTNQLELTNG